jgi:hypothetical protein
VFTSKHRAPFASDHFTITATIFTLSPPTRNFAKAFAKALQPHFRRIPSFVILL